MTTETRPIPWMAGLLITTRPDGRLRVVLAADATGEDRDRGGEIDRAMRPSPPAPEPDPTLLVDMERLLAAGQRNDARARLLASLAPALRAEVNAGRLTVE